MNNDLIKLVTSETEQQQPKIQLVHEIAWDKKFFPQIIGSAYISSDFNEMNARNPAQSKQPSRKFLKAYAYLPSVYIYEPALYNLYKTTNRADVALLYSLSSYVEEEENIVTFVLDQQENCFLISSAKNEEGFALWVNSNGKIVDQDSQYPRGYNHNIIGHDQNGYLYSSYDALACIDRNRGIMWEQYITSLVQENERYYYQDTVGKLNAQQQIELPIYHQNNNTPKLFVFPQEEALTAAPYSPLMVNVEQGKVYFRAGKQFNYNLYCFDWETQAFIEKIAYIPFNGERHFITQMYYPTWAIDSKGGVLIPVQGQDKFYIYRVEFS